MDKKVLVAGREDKATAELQWVLAEPVLFVAGSLGAAAGLHVVTAQQVQQGSVAQADSFVGLAFVVDEKRELDTRFLAKEFRIAGIAQSHNSETCAFLLEFFFGCAQLRNMLAAKNSTIVAQEHQDSRAALPKRAQARRLAFRIRERNSGEFAAIGLSHAGHSLGRASALSSILEFVHIEERHGG